MPFNIQPSRSLLGDMALGTSMFVGGYGQGYSQKSGDLIQAGSQAGAWAQNASNQFSQSYRQSYQMAGEMALAKKQHDWRITEMDTGHKYALENLGAGVFNDVNRSYASKNGGTPYYDITDPVSKQTIPGASGGLWRDYAVNADPGSLMSPAEFAADYSNKYQQSQVENRMKAMGMTYGVPPQYQSGNLEAEGQLRQLQTAPEFSYLRNADGTLNDQGQQQEAQIKARMVGPTWYNPGPTKAQQMQQEIVPLPQKDGSTVYAYPNGRGVGMKHIPVELSANGGGSDGGQYADMTPGETTLQALGNQMTTQRTMQSGGNLGAAAGRTYVAPKEGAPQGINVIYDPKTRATKIDATEYKAETDRRKMEAASQQQQARKEAEKSKIRMGILAEWNKNHLDTPMPADQLEKQRITVMYGPPLAQPENPSQLKDGGIYEMKDGTLRRADFSKGGFVPVD